MGDHNALLFPSNFREILQNGNSCLLLLRSRVLITASVAMTYPFILLQFFRMLEALRYVFAWLFIVLRTTGKFIWLMLRAARFPSQREQLGEGSENPFGWRHLKYHLEKHLLSLHKKAFLGKRAVNCRLLSADGETTYQLLDFMKDSRPLVLNFGSST